MCGIIFSILANDDPNFDVKAEENDVIFKHAETQNMRGPDRTSFIYRQKYRNNTIWYGFHRLAIQGDMTKINSSPAFIENDRALLLCNGEVYPKGIYKEKYAPHIISGQSDCEWILQEYMDAITDHHVSKSLDDHFDDVDHGHETRTKNVYDAMAKLLFSSEYALIIFDKVTEELFVCRDTFGIRPLFYTHGFYASELKYFPSDFLSNREIYQLPPGFFQGDPSMPMVRFKQHIGSRIINDNELVDGLYEVLMESVKNRIDYCDAEIGFLLSGGMDSSIICAMAQRSNNKKIRTFSIGMDANATDVIAAQIVADFIGSDHQTIIIPKEHFLANVSDVALISETWDTTTIRAGTGMYLIAKYISENTNIKVLVTGEGSDELFGSYRYFLNAPNAEEHYAETWRLLNDIHYFDVLRCDRTISNNGLEARVPFLDPAVVSYVSANFALEDYLPKHGMMKYYLRQVAKNYNLLPESIYYRPKEAFSDGVSTTEESWHNILEKSFENYSQATLVTENIPKTKESMYYRDLYELRYPNCNTIPYQWLPRWCGEQHDPSARTLNIKEQHIA